MRGGRRKEERENVMSVRMIMFELYQKVRRDYYRTPRPLVSDSYRWPESHDGWLELAVAASVKGVPFKENGACFLMLPGGLMRIPGMCMEHMSEYPELPCDLRKRVAHLVSLDRPEFSPVRESTEVVNNSENGFYVCVAVNRRLTDAGGADRHSRVNLEAAMLLRPSELVFAETMRWRLCFDLPGGCLPFLDDRERTAGGAVMCSDNIPPSGFLPRLRLMGDAPASATSALRPLRNAMVSHPSFFSVFGSLPGRKKELKMLDKMVDMQGVFGVKDEFDTWERLSRLGITREAGKAVSRVVNTAALEVSFRGHAVPAGGLHHEEMHGGAVITTRWGVERAGAKAAVMRCVSDIGCSSSMEPLVVVEITRDDYSLTAARPFAPLSEGCRTFLEKAAAGCYPALETFKNIKRKHVAEALAPRAGEEI